MIASPLEIQATHLSRIVPQQQDYPTEKIMRLVKINLSMVHLITGNEEQVLPQSLIQLILLIDLQFFMMVQVRLEQLADKLLHLELHQ
jgi:hypothetical protein